MLPSSFPLFRADGEPRKVGIEIEFGGLEVADAAGLIADAFDGSAQSVTPYEFRVQTPRFGEFVVEVDLNLLKRAGQSADAGWWDDVQERVLASMSGNLIPVEIGCPPVAIEDLPALEPLVPALRQAGARGTEAAPHFAFGVHLNVELPALDIRTLLAYVRAFACAEGVLREEVHANTARELLQFIAPWPRDYVRRILEPGYAPTVERFIDDYLEFNANRNRALDLLPILGELDRARVEAGLGTEVAPRPTLHYRLANSHVENPAWKLDTEWQRWAYVERLAANEDRLRDLGARLSDRLDQLFPASAEQWNEEVKKCLS